MGETAWRDPAETNGGGGARSPGRLVTLDFIRGIAVLGILYANIVGYAQPAVTSVWPGALPEPMSLADRIVWFVQFLLIDGKMRGLFAVLFGAGLVLFTEAKGNALQWRRLAWLGLFGAAHYFLLFRGDILFSYALCGMVVLVIGAHRLPAATALALGVAFYVLGAVFQAQPFFAALPEESAALAACADAARCIAAGGEDAYWANYAGVLGDAARETAVMRGGLWGIVGYNWTEHGTGLLSGGLMALCESFPSMLIGIGLYRAGLFDGGFDGDRDRRLLRWGLAGIAAGLLLTAPLAVWLVRAGDPFYLTFMIALGPAQIARLPMVLGLAAWLAWLAPRAADTALGQRLIAAGRMAFSNYLGTSLLMAMIFQGWGLGFFGEWGRAVLLLPMLFGCAVMLAWSRPWLARFAYGPLEWLWRCLTYGRIFPLKRAN